MLQEFLFLISSFSIRLENLDLKPELPSISFVICISFLIEIIAK